MNWSESDLKSNNAENSGLERERWKRDKTRIVTYSLLTAIAFFFPFSLSKRKRRKMDFIHKIEQLESSVAAVHACLSVGITSSNKIKPAKSHVKTTNQIVTHHKN